MKLSAKCLVVLSILAVSGPAFGAAFNYPSVLINIPTVRPMVKGDYSMSTTMGFFDAKKNDFDVAFDYAVSNRVKVGVAVLKPTQMVGHAHWQFYNGKKFGAAAGVLNMTDSDGISSWEGYPNTQDTSFSQYIVTRYNFKRLSVHLGYGTKQFVKGNPGKNNSALMEGMFWAFELPLKHVRLAYEFDGKDYNFGVIAPISKSAEFHVALTELFLGEKTNPNYSNAPVRLVTFGFTFFGNWYKADEPESAETAVAVANLEQLMAEMKVTQKSLQTEVDSYRKSRLELEESLTRVQAAMKSDTRYVMEQDQKKKDELRQHYLGVNQEIGEKVITLYYDSFELYSQKDYFKAIEALQKAIVLDPYMPQLYTRLGSIYFELGMKKEATESWKKAYSLDPENDELKEFLNPSSAQQSAQKK